MVTIYCRLLNVLSGIFPIYKTKSVCGFTPTLRTLIVTGRYTVVMGDDTIIKTEVDIYSEDISGVEYYYIKSIGKDGILKASLVKKPLFGLPHSCVPLVMFHVHRNSGR